MILDNHLFSVMSELRLEDNIAILTLKNGKYNRLIRPDFIELDMFQNWMQQMKPTSLLIVGSGRNFCAGADLDEIKKYSQDISYMSECIDKGKAILNYIEKLDMITVSAIGGCCYGGGLEIALSCQYRIASEGSFFSFPESKLGLLPGLGGTKRLKNVIGKSNAIKMILNGDIYSVEEAYKLHLVDSIVKKGTQLQESIEFVSRLCESNMFESHLTEIIHVINSGSESMERDLFLKYLSQQTLNI